MENEILNIKLDDIIPNRFQPREVFDEEALEKLADSIKQHGVIEPILVRPVANKFEIIAGERRYKASVLAGLTKIPAIVKQMDDKESSIVAYIENEHRSDVSAIEEARTIDRILKSNDMTQEELAKELGINQSTIANKIRLLNLPMEVQESLMHNEISERHARSLLSVKDSDKQIELLNKIKEKRMTVRELDGEIKSMYNENNVNNYGNNMNNQGITNNYQMPNQYQEPVQTQSSDFMSFLSNYDNTRPLPGNESVTNNPMPNKEDGFNDYLNNYNNDYSNPITNNQSNIPPTNDGFNNYLNNNVSNPTPTPPVDDLTSNDDFMRFLNAYDNNHPVSEVKQTPEVREQPMSGPIMPNVNQNPTPPINNEITNNDDFMNYLNNYNNDVPNNIPPVNNQTVPTPEPANDYMSFLNNINNDINNNVNNNINNNVSNEPAPVVENNYVNNANNYNIPTNNVMLNDVIPPITSGMDVNQYVEDNPNYVDVSQNVMIDNVDDVIERLKNVIDDIKATSNLKIDTDEINYDDLYQITIKIDKRNY